MGVRGLWAALSPHCEKKSLHEIRGERLAVDLAGWVCDSQNVTDHHAQPKLYLRNLFFRTSYLLLSEIKPIFVLEGDAPDLKRDEMARRNALQFCGAAPKSNGAVKRKPDVTRKRFKGVLRECENLLRCMGVCCVKGSGEAEATCAYLNAEGLVDAVISQDSDCFAYGARLVYRNFSVSNSAGGGALQGSVDCYDAAAVSREIGFSRNKMVALALLCGCDYGVGAVGSSVATALAFLHTLADAEVIPRLLSWVTDPEFYASQERWMKAPGRCERCGHAGRSHVRNGCPVCVTHRACNDTGHKAKLAAVRRELALRARALSCGTPFPEPRVMKEFLRAEEAPSLPTDLHTPAPSLIKFVNLMREKLGWTERYCVEKFLPLLTRWHLDSDPVSVPAARTLRPARINKKRTPRGVPSFEVVWLDVNGHYDGLVPDDQIEEGENPEVVWTTTERQDLMRLRYSELVEAYEESIKKPVKEKKSRGRRKKETDGTPLKSKPKRKYTKKTQKIVNDIDNLNSSMNNMSLRIDTVLKLKNTRLVKDTDLKNTGLELNDNSLSIKDSNSDLEAKYIHVKQIGPNQKDISLNDNEIRFNIEDVNLKAEDTSIGRGVSVTKLKRKLKTSKNHKSIDGILAKKRKSRNVIETLNDSFKNMSINYLDEENEIATNVDCDTEVAVRPISMLELSDDSFRESDLSDLIDHIVTRDTQPKTTRVDNNLVKLIFSKRCSTPQKIKTDFRRSILGEIKYNSSTPKNSPKKKGNSDLKYSFRNFSSSNNAAANNSSCSNEYDSCKAKSSSYSNKYINSAASKNSSESIKCNDTSSFSSKRISHKCNASNVPVVNTSYFFDKLTDECDVFELSMDYKMMDDCHEEDKTVEYSFGNSVCY